MHRFLTSLLSTTLSLLICAAFICALAPLAPPATAAELVTKTIELNHGTIDQLRIHGHSNLSITFGETSYIKVIGTKSRIEQIQATINGHILRVKTYRKKSQQWLNSSELRLEIQLKNLTKLRLDDVAQAQVAAIKNETFRLEAGDGSDIILQTIDAHQVTFAINDNVNLQTQAIAADQITLRADDSSRIKMASITAHTLAVDVTDSSYMTVNRPGTVDNMQLDMGDAARFTATTTVAKIITAKLGDAALAKVHVTDSLTVKAGDAAKLTYIGHPIHRQVTTNDAAKIVRVDAQAH